ncbi:hypothetical protein AM1_0182 [Acaryochloris marina MBIC11017]|uniref:Uncharacterized protein n=1 Tax=Acaryochloris marina (strain MBIC 11017) TaxID=329726 RepID=B0C7K7_ACAM1|nr:hypothetical protein AM1_0182 [Acaryochloris marina MBIC11017]
MIGTPQHLVSAAQYDIDFIESHTFHSSEMPQEIRTPFLFS